MVLITQEKHSISNYESRVIIKNLPKHLKEDRLREHFQKQGHVTDVKLMKKSDGTSRKFAFIGFKTEKEAKAAVRYFNNTFIDTSKITLEIAKPVGDSSLPKPWSKISLEKAQKEEEKRKESEVKIVEERKMNQNMELLKQAEKDQKLKEYLEVYQSRTQTKTWANEDTANSFQPKVKVQTVKSKKAGGENVVLTKTHLTFDNDDDDEYQDLNKDTKVEGEKEKELEKDELVFDNNVSDMDYLKARMKQNVSDEKEIDDNNEKEEPKQGLKDELEEKTEKTEETEIKEELSPEAQILDNGRLFVRNLPYTCTEDDLRKLFEKHGPLSEVHMPISKESKKPKGFAYILYLLPEHALKAFNTLDKSFFQGRLLHILPSKDKLNTEVNLDDQNLSLRKKKELKMRQMATNSYNWNSLFLSQDAVADAVAAKLGITKGELMDPASDDLATKLATAETKLLMEIKDFFEEHGVDLSVSNKEKSDTVIIVKNIPYGTEESQLLELFGKHGEIERVLIPPSKTIAIIEFKHPTEARAAFRHLAYRRFGDAPLYLEKAPKDVFKMKVEKKIEPKEEKVVTIEKILAKEEELVEGATLFVKNLNFETTKERLQECFEVFLGFKSAIVRTKPDTKNPGKTLSLGFGFVEFDSPENAALAMSGRQDYMLDGHKLVIKISERATKPKKEESKPVKGAKLLIKNIPFEATKRDIRELFSTFGTIKTLRLPSKFSGGHRGFCFIEFITEKEAAKVMDNLSHTHLYGRHLVITYADEDESVDKLREKVKSQFDKDNQPKKRRVVLEDEENEGDMF
ncbi:RNA-binding domain-containing protein [Neoconidiobolus thromboides FSU 785]|nr:RNA-binding domain-containing protein [Neoconidiobolus thromboides FSU 785]